VSTSLPKSSKSHCPRCNLQLEITSRQNYTKTIEAFASGSREFSDFLRGHCYLPFIEFIKYITTKLQICRAFHARQLHWPPALDRTANRDTTPPAAAADFVRTGPTSDRDGAIRGQSADAADAERLARSNDPGYSEPQHAPFV
jgi:hypothetical protein